MNFIVRVAGIIAPAALLWTANLASAQDLADAEDATTTDQVTEAAPKKKICRLERQTGSRLSQKKVCHTAADWADLDRETARLMDKARVEPN